MYCIWHIQVHIFVDKDILFYKIKKENVMGNFTVLDASSNSYCFVFQLTNIVKPCTGFYNGS
jgi:hypothetical protein